MAETKAESAPNPALSGAFELFGKSMEIVQRNLSNFAVVSILPLLSVLSSYATDTDSSTSAYSSFGSFAGWSSLSIAGALGFGFVVMIAFIIASLFIQAMTYDLELEGAKGKTPTLNQLIEVAKKFWLRLFGLVVIVGLLTVGGFILFIIPGLIVLRRYFFAPYIMIDNDVSISEAMRRSADMTKPVSWDIYSILGVTFLISLTGAVPVIGSLLALGLGIIYSVAPALRYQEVKKLPKA